MKTNFTKWMGALALVIGMSLFGTGCVVHERRGHAHVHGPTVRVQATHGYHHHSYRGSHYRHAHVHGPGCGHHFRGGVWIH